MTENATYDAAASTVPGMPAPVPGFEALLDRLGRLAEDRDDEVGEVIRLAALEVARVRTDVARAAAVRLAEAEAEARDILDDARAHAEAMRAAGLAALRRRVDESQGLVAPGWAVTGDEPVESCHLRLAPPLSTS